MLYQGNEDAFEVMQVLEETMGNIPDVSGSVMCVVQHWSVLRYSA